MMEIGKLMKDQVMVYSIRIIGKFTYANGAYYDGEWKNSKFHGRGNFIGLMEGEFKDENGELFEGVWVNGKKEGRGKDF